MKLSTYLISGAGNTFHVTSADAVDGFDEKRKQEIAVAICQKIPADGFIFLKKHEMLSWDFYNKDGSVAEMCGNATRCVGLYVKNILHDPGLHWTLKTKAGLIKIESSPTGVKIDESEDEKIELGMKEVVFRVTMTPIKILSSSLGFFCDTGVPHLVIEGEANIEQGRALRLSAEFAPKGTNVTFVKLLPQVQQLKAVSYERGVEGFTQACGTGAMAAAAYNLHKRKCPHTFVEMPGGVLEMDLQNLASPQMQGPARLIAKHEHRV